LRAIWYNVQWPTVLPLPVGKPHPPGHTLASQSVARLDHHAGVGVHPTQEADRLRRNQRLALGAAAPDHATLNALFLWLTGLRGNLLAQVLPYGPAAG
jgi:hypothetical protein